MCDVGEHGELPLVFDASGAHIRAMTAFNYQASAELFYPRRMGRTAPLEFQRFDTSAEAIKFAIEQLTPASLHGAVIELESDRLDSSVIRKLYESDHFPLARADV